MKKKRKIKWVNIVVLSILLLCIVGLTISIINIVKWNIDKNNIKDQIQDLAKISKIKEISDNSNTEIIKQLKKPLKSNPYWDYIKMNMINVDFNKLKSINNNVKGWIKLNGTNINYPFVQTTDNKYYLTHSFDKSYNQAGWVFLDYRNSIKSLNKNIIIYAHGRLDTTMFGSLKNIIKSNWYNNPNNYIVKLSTEYENTLWQVFSVYHIETTSDYLQTYFNNDNEYKIFLNKLINRSMFNFNTTINSTDNILTLSTCYNKTEKVVMHAKLIKRYKR